MLAKADECLFMASDNNGNVGMTLGSDIADKIWLCGLAIPSAAGRGDGLVVLPPPHTRTAALLCPITVWRDFA